MIALGEVHAVTEVDIWRAASMLIETHGEAAELQATSKINQRQKKRDKIGVAVWNQILNAIVVLRAAAPSKPMN